MNHLTLLAGIQSKQCFAFQQLQVGEHVETNHLQTFLGTWLSANQLSDYAPWKNDIRSSLWEVIKILPIIFL